MTVPDLHPIEGVSPLLLQAVNERLRMLAGAMPAASPQASASTSATSGTTTTLVSSSVGETHAARLSSLSSAYSLGMLWYETDRQVLYQMHTVSGVKAWVYVSGIMCAVLGSEPGDLGTNDVGFAFLASDTYQLFRWSGSAWVDLTPGNYAQIAFCSLALVLAAGAFNDIPGCTLTLARAGRHLITGCFQFAGAGADTNDFALGQLVANGVVQAGNASFQPLVLAATNCQGTVFAQWNYTAAAAGQVVKLQAEKNAGTGGSVAGTNSSISALWIGP